MDLTILLEIAKAFGRFFINPLLYVVILAAIFLGYRRVKMERKSFNIRILGGWSELKNLVVAGAMLSFMISWFNLIVGLTVPVQFLLVVMVLSIIGLISYVYHFLSAGIIFSLSFIVLFILDWQNISFELFGYMFGDYPFDDGYSITVAIIIGLLLMAEGILIRRHGVRVASPRIEVTKRGLNAVAYFSKKIWVLPIIFVVPGDAIQAYYPLWPQFILGSQQFSIVLFPVVLGFQQIVRTTMPIYFYPKVGNAVLTLGELVLLGGLVAYFEPVISLIVIVFALTMRIGIAIYFKVTQMKDNYKVIRNSKGAMIATVLPNSPAEKMGLVAGEILKRVNGQEIFTERELYEALQINAAHCRLEVLDHNGEIRLTQHVVHGEDHHSIGVLLVH